MTASGTSGNSTNVAGYGIDLAGAQGPLEGHRHLMMPNASIQVYESPDLPECNPPCGRY